MSEQELKMELVSKPRYALTGMTLLQAKVLLSLLNTSNSNNVFRHIDQSTIPILKAEVEAELTNLFTAVDEIMGGA